MPEWREMTKQIDWTAKQPSQMACVSKDLKCWGAWDTTIEAQSQRCHTINLLAARGVETGSAQQSSLKRQERAIINQANIGTVLKAMLGKLLKDGWSFSECINTTLNWTDDNVVEHDVHGKKFTKIAAVLLGASHVTTKLHNRDTTSVENQECAMCTSVLRSREMIDM